MKDKITDKATAKLFYYLILSDGKITDEEEEKYVSICKELEIKNTYAEECREECKKKLSMIIDEDDYDDIITENVQDVIRDDIDENSFSIWSHMIPIKLFLWDLLCVAFSDGDYSAPEKKIVKKVIRAFDIETSLYQEMVAVQDTVNAIKAESEELKDSGLPYREVQQLDEELQNRIKIIEQSVMLMIKE